MFSLDLSNLSSRSSNRSAPRTKMRRLCYSAPSSSLTSKAQERSTTPPSWRQWPRSESTLIKVTFKLSSMPTTPTEMGLLTTRNSLKSYSGGRKCRVMHRMHLSHKSISNTISRIVAKYRTEGSKSKKLQ